MKLRKKYSTKQLKQIKAMLKRHYQALGDSEHVGTDWPQSMVSSSMRRRSQRIRYKRKLEAIKQRRYSKDLAKALKLWEDQN